MRRSLFLLCALALACGSKTTRKLVILHTNDEHSHLLGSGPEADEFPLPTAKGSGSIKGGASRRSEALATARDAARSAGADTLTVSAGDNMMGTMVQITETVAAPDYRVMKMLGYDVTTLGNHEFDYGPGNLATILTTAKGSAEGMPAIVTSNIHFSGGSGDSTLAAQMDELGTDATKTLHRRLVVTTANGLKVGFVGIMGADAAAVAPLKAPTYFSRPLGSVDDNRIAALAQIYTDIQPVVDALRRDDKVDLVVALSHGGMDPGNPAKSEDYSIAQNVPGIDVIVSGHSHTEVPATLVTNLQNGHSVLVQQAGRFGDNLGRISVSVDSDGVVAFDMGSSGLTKIDDSTNLPSDAAINTFVGGIIGALESAPLAAGKPSFLKLTLGEILQAAPPEPASTPGALYNYSLATLGYDIDNSTKYQETELLDLAADAQLAAANSIAPTDLAVDAYGVIRVSKLEKGKTGKLNMGDVFRAVPLGGSPVAGTLPGYPLCRFGILLAEVKAAFEVTAGFAYSGHDDLYLVPSGFKFEYDTTRPAFNANGDALSKDNGRITKIWQLNSADLAAGNYDGAYTLKFDASTPASPGWMANPLSLVRVASSLYIATFATFAGVHLRDPATGAPIAGNDPTATIVHRADTTEIKEWEALGSYVKKLATANSGALPNTYKQGDPAGPTPRRAICTGANASNGNCTH